MVLAAPAITLAMIMSGMVAPRSYDEVWMFLVTRVPLIALAAMSLAVLMTARVAGPLIQLQRAFEDVAHGEMDRRLRFRRSDKHLLELEKAFEGMMIALNERADSPASLED